MEFLKFLDYGAYLAGIAGMVIMLRMFMKFLSNHMSEATKSNQRLADAIETMLRFLEK